MQKYILFGLIVLVIIIVGFFIYQNNTSQNTILNQQKITMVEFKEGSVIIDSKDQSCNLDNDCILFQPDCEDCNFDVINKKDFSKYTDAKNKYCSINKPEKQCDIIFTGKLQCVSNKCVLE